MTSWWWVRHGPTHAKGLIGWTDLPADLGDHAALSRIRRYLPGDAVIVASDLKRCVATADAIQGSRTRLPDAAAIRELNFGNWETKTFSEVAKSDPKTARAYWGTPGDIAPPNGESWNQTSLRVAQFVDRMNRRFPDGNIVAVAHFGVILSQLQRAGKMSAQSALSFKIGNLSVTRLEFLDPDWQILGVNQQP